MVGFISDMSATDASNTSFAGLSQADSVMLPGGVPDDFRAHDGALRRWHNDLGGIGTVGGTATAITLTTAQAFTAYGTAAGQIPNGALIAFKPTSDCAGATTLNINSIGTKKIRRQGDVACQVADWISTDILLLRYDTAYDTAAGAWVLLNPHVHPIAGTWTPALNFGGATTGITYTSRSARYTRLGGTNKIIIDCQFVLSSKGSATGAATISGLPYTAATTYFANLSTGFQSITSAGAAAVQSEVNSNAATISLYLPAAGVSAAMDNTSFSNTSQLYLSGIYEAA